MPNESPLALTSTGQAPRWMAPDRLLRISIAVALLTIVLKTGAWWVSGSVSLLSDALESFVNLAGAMFALAMVTVARRPADASHPFGHHKAEYFSSGFEGILIVGASMAILWAAGWRLWQPQPLEQLGWGMALSLVSTAFNGGLAWVMWRAARIHRSLALEGDARHLMTDVWTSVGVVVGLIAASVTGWRWLDPLVAIGVGLNILREGGALVWRASQGLMDEALPAEHLAQIEAVLDRHVQDQRGAVQFDGVSTRQAGARSFVVLHLHAPAEWTLGRVAQLRTQVEADLMQAVPGLHAAIELLPHGMATEFERRAEQIRAG